MISWNAIAEIFRYSPGLAELLSREMAALSLGSLSALFSLRFSSRRNTGVFKPENHLWIALAACNLSMLVSDSVPLAVCACACLLLVSTRKASLYDILRILILCSAAIGAGSGRILFSSMAFVCVTACEAVMFVLEERAGTSYQLKIQIKDTDRLFQLLRSERLEWKLQHWTCASGADSLSIGLSHVTERKLSVTLAGIRALYPEQFSLTKEAILD